MRYKAFIRTAFLTVFGMAGVMAARASDWPVVPPEELTMTSEPLAPGAPAIILYRQVDHRDDDVHRPYETNSYEIKILTEEGRKYADVEIPYVRDTENVFGIEARTIQPDGSIVKFDGKVLDKTIEKANGVRYLAKTFTLSDVRVGSIIEYRYGKDWEEYELYDSHWTVSDDLFTKHARFSLVPYTEETYTCRWIWRGLPAGSPVPKQDPRGVVRLEVQNIPAFPQEEYGPSEDALKARVDFIYSEKIETDPNKYWKQEGKRLYLGVEGYVKQRDAMAQAVVGLVGANDAPEVKLRKIYERVQQMRNLSYETETTDQKKKREEYSPHSETIWDSGPGDLVNPGLGGTGIPGSGGVPGGGSGGLSSPVSGGGSSLIGGTTGSVSYTMLQRHNDYLKNASKITGNAEKTWKRGYGDNADLNWLFLGLVRAAGFEAWSVKVPSRNEYIFDPKTPNVQQLNENAVLVKLNGQELFFNPATKFVPYGLLPWDETGVTGLRLDSDGGTWTNTPLPPSSVSRTMRKAELKLDDAGTVQGNLTVTYSGHEASLRRQEEFREDSAARKKFLEDEVKGWVPVASEVELKNTPDWDSSAETLVAEFALKVPGWAVGTKQRATIPAGLFGGSEKHVFESADRLEDISFQFPFEKTDDVTIELPAGWQVGTLPPAQKIDSEFCGYTLQAEGTKGTLHLTRDLAIHGVWMDRQYYENLREFFQAVRAEDRLQILVSPERKTLAGFIRAEGSQDGIASARVELQDAAGVTIALTSSRADGAFYFEDLAGDCYIVAQHDGYSPARELVNTQGLSDIHVTVYQRKLNPESTTNSANLAPAIPSIVPADARGAFEKGEDLLNKKSAYGAAAAQFRRAIGLAPSYYEAYAAMGMAKYKLGYTAEAETSLRKSIELSQERFPESMMDLALILNSQNRFAEAEPILRKVIAMDDSSWRGHYELAVALAGLKRPGEAAASAAKARDLKPDDPQIYFLLYNLHIVTDDYSSAVRDADAYLKISPSGAMATRMRRLREQAEKALQTSQRQPAQGPSGTGTASLKVSLRLQDNLPFSGSAKLRLAGSLGSEVIEKSTVGASGEAVFPGVRPGNYVFEASAPGFVPVKQSIEIKPDQAPDTLFLIMKPETPSNIVSESKTAPPAKAASVIPPDVDESVPAVAADVPCSLYPVLYGAGLRAEDFVNNMQRFGASERVEHFPVNGAGAEGGGEVRSFDYVAEVLQDPQAGFEVNEYRNGSAVSPRQFPAGIATSNLPIHALIFHPSLASGFNFTCEGLGQWKGRPAWLVHFEEKQDKPIPFRSYGIDKNRYPVQLKGRAWIDASTHQVLRMETDLVKPLPEIHLTRDHVSIEYGLVQFQTHNEQLWLPQSADLYVEWGRHRFYRRHTFSDFKIFSIQTAQDLKSPKESYCFTNVTDGSISGILTVSPLPGKATKSASLTLTIPAGKTVCESIGLGQDINFPADALGSTTFAHNGPAGAVQVDAYVVKETTLEIKPNTPIPGASKP